MRANTGPGVEMSQNHWKSVGVSWAVGEDGDTRGELHRIKDRQVRLRYST